MLDPAIQEFLNERKESRIKSKTNTDMQEEEKLVVAQLAEEAFTIESWLPDAAKRASQLAMVTHPGKFSHPSAKISPIIANARRQPDGYLRTGNVASELDVLGNAAAMDVFKFLMLPLKNGKTVLQNLEDNTEDIQQILSIQGHTVSELRNSLLAIKHDENDNLQTSERIKQVYFPISDDYHLLSILTPSGLVFKLKERINEIRFSENAKQAREAKQNKIANENGFEEIYGLTVIGFGGTKPQNISVLNNQNYGQAYLLQSSPPVLKARDIHPPKRNFFSNTLNPWHYKESFENFHKLIAVDYNNINIRKGRDKLIRFIILQVVERLWMIRQLEPGWSESETYTGLPTWQKHWLDQKYTDERENDDDWLDKVTDDLARWFLVSYGKIHGDKAKKAGADELPHIKHIIIENKEGLR